MRTLKLLLLLLSGFLSAGLLAQQNVGIGTTAPQELLHIQNGNLRVQDAFAKMQLHSGGQLVGQMEINGFNFWLSNYTSSGAMILRTNNAPRVYITSTGKIGMNTTSPEELLHVKNGNIRFEGENKYMDLYASSPANTGWRFYRDGSFRGGMQYVTSDDKLRITNNFNNPGFEYDLVNRRLGIGVMDPLETFHVMDGAIRHESDNKYFDIVSTDSTFLNGLRFYQRSNFHGGMFMNLLTSKFNISNSAGADGLVMDFNNNNVGIGTDTPLDNLHVIDQVRIEDPTAPRLKLYTGSTYSAFLQHFAGNLYLANQTAGSIWFRTQSSTRMTIDAVGEVGIGTTTPDTRLDIQGDNNWDLGSSEGDFRLGDASYRIKMGVALDGGGAGTGRIYASGGTNRLILGAGTEDVIAIEETGEVGIGTNTPNYTLDIQHDDTRSLNIENTYSGSSAKYGAFINVTADGTSSKYGLYSRSHGGNGSSGYVYGLRGYANGNGTTGNSYGVYAQVSATGDGNNFGVYTTANTTDPAPGKKSWALYAVGHSYFQNDVRIGTLDGATGYRLSVNGKIMAEELKIQLDSNWPDYVFQEDYALPALSDVRAHIEEKGHLPGVPSAAEVDREDGFHVGDMQKILLEKIEELTLYTLQQEERLEAQDKRISELEARLAAGN